MSSTVETWPKLYKKRQDDDLQEWEVSVYLTPDQESIIRIVSGKQYALQKVTEEEVWQAKSQPTPLDQAIFEANKKWKDKKRAGYYETQEEAHTKTPDLPMLAQKWKDSKHRMKYPILCQPKLNGVRAIVRVVPGRGVVFTSRGGKEFTALREHSALCTELESLYAQTKCPIDGELYIHGWCFQDIVSAVKKAKVATLLLEYHAFDLVDKEPQRARLYLLESILTSNNFIHIKPVLHTLIYEGAEVQRYFDKCVSGGYEGVIMRSTDAPYQRGKRSPHLQKLKPTQDAEFEIVGAREEENSINGETTRSIIFKCITPEGYKFNCRPKGTLKEREKWLERKHEYIGKNLTVQFQEYSKDKVPIFPVGIGVRDYE